MHKTDMKILKFINTWTKATILSTFPMLRYSKTAKLTGTRRNLEGFHSYMNDNFINISQQIPYQGKI